MTLKTTLLGLTVLPFIIACGGGEKGSSDGIYIAPPSYAPKYTLTAWNDLGMHCMDGKDFSVFSVLPPYNNLHAQLKYTNTLGLIDNNGTITLTYEAIPDMNGSTNTTSVNKTNFWTYVKQLFGTTLQPDVGLTGNPMASTIPAQMTFNTTHQWWEAEAIPLTPYTDGNSTKNYYPLVKVVAKDANGTVLASTKVVLPVSDEMDCKRCHATNSNVAARPIKGWMNDANLTAEQDYKYNILRLHDQIQPNAVSTYKTALLTKGYDYNVTGLEATAKNGMPVLCAACHKTNALPNVGIGFNPVAPKAFTAAIHSRHANVLDPANGMTLNNSNNRNACYSCHPGSLTNCLRGAMGDAKDVTGQNTMQCQSCHGGMANVGDLNREGWFNEPNCQACHHDAVRETSARNANGTLKTWIDARFATKPNTPAAGLSLYRFSTGHGNLQCEACHGSTHAVFPAHTADNLMSINAQGHTGTVAECKTCHATIPATVTGGPHGMHPIGDYWVSAHQSVARVNPGQCTVCHGTTYRGSVLSKTWTARTFYNGKSYLKGATVTCYDCHNGPSGG